VSAIQRHQSANMPSHKGTRVHGVSYGFVPGTVDIQPRVGEVCTHIHKAQTHAYVSS